MVKRYEAMTRGCVVFVRAATVLMAVLWLGQMCGCGGSAMSTATRGMGSVTFRVEWPSTPPAGRFVPAAANCVKVLMQDGAKIVGSKVVQRPAGASSVTGKIENLPAKPLTAVAEAFPTLDGTGVAQAVGSQTLTIVQDKDTPVTVTMTNTIVGATITDYNGFATLTMAPGDTDYLELFGLDSKNRHVVVLHNTLKWSSADATIATVDSTGTVTAVATGTTTIMGTEPESGFSATITITVGDRKYQLGGDGPDGSWSVDDNLDVYINGTIVFTTGNGASGTHAPIVFTAKKGDSGKLVVRDTFGFCTSLSRMVLTRYSQKGNLIQIDPGFNGGCGRPGGDQGVSHTMTFTITF